MYPIEKYHFVTYDRENEDGSVSKVTVALTTYAGKIVKGVAKCIATDTYDPEVGKKLAAARCDEKVCEKRLNRAMKKYNNAIDSLTKLEDYVRRINNFYADSYREFNESRLKRQELESKLR